jgi:hypothetical protein
MAVISDAAGYRQEFAVRWAARCIAYRPKRYCFGSLKSRKLTPMAKHPGKTGLGSRGAHQRTTAWLAIFALLIQAVLPIVLASSARADEPAPGVPLCGHYSHDHSVPSNGLPLTSGHCCPFCCAVANGPVPVPPYGFAAPIRFAAIRRPVPLALAVMTRSAREPAQARAPPTIA